MPAVPGILSLLAMGTWPRLQGMTVATALPSLPTCVLGHPDQAEESRSTAPAGTLLGKVWAALLHS